MKNIRASAGVFPAQEKKEVKEEDEEEECFPMRNEMVFYLLEDPTYQISAVGEWGENARGDMVKEAETYFLHIMTGARCESAWGCLVGWSEGDEEATKKWETLCQRIEDYGNIEENICFSNAVGV